MDGWDERERVHWSNVTLYTNIYTCDIHHIGTSKTTILAIHFSWDSSAYFGSVMKKLYLGDVLLCCAMINQYLGSVTQI